jgi:hypothetical protein
MQREAFLSEFLEFCKAYQSLFVTGEGARDAGAAERKRALEDFCRELLNRYFGLVRARLVGPTAELVQALEIVYLNLMNMHAQLPDLGFADRAADITNNAVNAQIDRLADQLLPALRAALDAASVRLVSAPASAPSPAPSLQVPPSTCVCVFCTLFACMPSLPLSDAGCAGAAERDVCGRVLSHPGILGRRQGAARSPPLFFSSLPMR